MLREVLLPEAIAEYRSGYAAELVISRREKTA